jgi:hypothetical protein
LTEAFREPPHIIVEPGPEYADSTRRFQGIPGLERSTSGRLWATWYGGRGTSQDHLNHVLLARFTEEDVLALRAMSSTSALRLVVNQATGEPV